MKNKLDHSVNHRIATVAGLLKRQVFRIISEHHLEITPEQWSILSHLWEKDGMTIKELTEKSKKDFANVTRIVEKLQKQEYVTKRKNKNDGRSILVSLTPKSTTIKPEIEICQKRSLCISLQNISREEQETILHILKKIENNTLSYLKESLEQPSISR